MFKPKLMPKISSGGFIMLALCGGSNLTFAENITKPSGLSCNRVAISISTPESTIEANCKVSKLRNDEQIISGQSANKVKTDDPLEERDPTISSLSKIKFTTDDGSTHLCYYRNNHLLKCQAS